MYYSIYETASLTARPTTQ